MTYFPPCHTATQRQTTNQYAPATLKRCRMSVLLMAYSLHELFAAQHHLRHGRMKTMPDVVAAVDGPSLGRLLVLHCVFCVCLFFSRA